METNVDEYSREMNELLLLFVLIRVLQLAKGKDYL